MQRKRKLYVVLFIVVLSLMGCGKDAEQVQLEAIAPSEQEQSISASEEEQASVVVYVCGAVEKAGVYELPAGSRVFEAIQMAGGFTKKAAVSQLNQAEILEDEAFLYVPAVDEVSVDGVSTGGGKEAAKVNLNKATKEELMTLSGVGEAKASQIIQYREEHGKFKRIEDIMNISGIKEGLFEKIKDKITVQTG